MRSRALRGLDASRTDVLRWCVPRDQRPYNVAYYAKNRDAEIERVMRRQQATLAWLRDLRRVPCLDCGGTFPPHVMDFDHRDPKQKLFNVTGSRAMLMVRSKLEAEIAKCDIVCANCHRIRTYAAFNRGDIRAAAFYPRADEGTPKQQRSRVKWHRARTAHMQVLRTLRERPCLDCGKSFPWYVMQFDHRDPSGKKATVPDLAGRVSTSRLLEEIAKCDIVCTNCHRDRTYRQWQERGCVVVEASDPSKIEVRVRFPPPAPDQLKLIEESLTPYRAAA
jgi:hypothetical protein